MKLFTKPQLAQLLLNGQPEHRKEDQLPVVKLFFRGSDCVWLLTRIDPENQDLAYGLCDSGNGFPELGHISLKLLSDVRTRFGIERDRYFIARYPISIYACAAHKHGAIVEDFRRIADGVK